MCAFKRSQKQYWYQHIHLFQVLVLLVTWQLQPWLHAHFSDNNTTSCLQKSTHSKVQKKVLQKILLKKLKTVTDNQRLNSTWHGSSLAFLTKLRLVSKLWQPLAAKSYCKYTEVQSDMYSRETVIVSFFVCFRFAIFLVCQCCSKLLTPSVPKEMPPLQSWCSVWTLSC